MGAWKSATSSFNMGTESFSKVHFMVDGIYPELAQFAKMVAVPLNK